PLTRGSVPAARVSGFHVAFSAAAVLLGAAWAIVLLQRIRQTREPRPVDVAPEVAARAVGCAQSAAVLIGVGKHQTLTSGGASLGLALCSMSCRATPNVVCGAVKMKRTSSVST